ncbi:B-cell lymphoma/leukemia 10 [Gastrophryne carolinensis]
MTPLKLNDDEMAEIKRDAIEYLRPYLCDKLMAERHFDYLRSKKILDKGDQEEIQSHTTSSKRAGEMLDRLVKNPKGLDALIESIRLLRTQDFLIEKITDEVLRVKNMKIESYKGCGLSSPSQTSNGYSEDLYRQNSAESKLCSAQGGSTVLYHPEGESSLTVNFKTTPAFTEDSIMENQTKSSRQGSLLSPRLPRPGEAGAPPLPMTLPVEHEDPSTIIDSQFLPLRSTSPCNPY